MSSPSPELVSTDHPLAYNLRKRKRNLYNRHTADYSASKSTRHSKTNRSQNNVATTQKTSYACSRCGKKYLTRSKAFKIHLRTMPCLKKHICVLCKKSFTRKFTLVRHNQKYHNEVIGKFSKFWDNLDSRLDENLNAQAEMNSFRDELAELQICKCKVCHEAWFTTTPLIDETCASCHHDTNEIKKFSDANDMNPLHPPQELQCLSLLEEMLIARACPIMRVYTKRGGQTGYTGYVINLQQDLTEFATTLPRSLEDIPLIYLRKANDAQNTYRDFRVNRNHIKNALKWLFANNHLYADITSPKKIY